MSVAVLLVSHDGARWLPTVLAALADQIEPVPAGIAVDTGSRDESVALLRDAFGEDRVVAAGSGTSFPAAVRLGLSELERLGLDHEWVWLLHDDCAPHPEALLALLAGTAERPDADILGPMVREWPSLRGILELGVTLSGTGRRETGLERGEYDQGQYVEPRLVLAVNTAGMLVRRSVLEELGGFDEALPMFGNDIDFGWRAAARGKRTVVIPQAIVFHAEAAHRGTRQTPLTGRHTHYQERRAALHTLLVNGRGSLAVRLIRLTLGTVVRMVGFLALRSPGEALDDLAALVSVTRHLPEILAARRDRRAATTHADAVRRLLPPWWLPYRHGLDFVRDLAGALGQQASDVADRRRAARADLDSESFAARRVERLARIEEEEFAEDTGVVARFFTNPVAVLMASFVVLALVAARGYLGDLAGGGLSPTPESAGTWWHLHVASSHAVGQGSELPAPAYVAPLALLATLLGSPAAALSALLVLAVPAAAWGAWRFLRVTGRLARPQGAPRWVILWGTTTYALVPVVAGAAQNGRLGPVVSAVLLPWLGHAALGFADPEADRRWRAAWRSGLLLTLVVAFSPVAWLVALLLAALVLAVAFRLLPTAMSDASTWRPPALALVLPTVLLLPWWVPLLVHGAPGALVLDAGRLPGVAGSGADLLAGRLVGGAPWWLGLIVPVLALIALAPRVSRIPVLITWLVAVVVGVVAAGLGLVDVSLVAGSSPVGQGFLLVALQGAFVVAACLAAPTLVAALTADWRRRSVALVVILAAGVAPVGGLVWLLLDGAPDLDEPVDPDVPAYMVQSSQTGAEHGVLVLRGSLDEGLTFVVRRDDGIRLGEDEIVAHTSPDAAFTTLISTLVATPGPDAVADLGRAGIEYVVMPAPADPEVAAEFDAAAGLVVASAENRQTRAWQVQAPLAADQVDGGRAWWRVVLLVVQGGALLVTLASCAPTLRERRM